MAFRLSADLKNLIINNGIIGPMAGTWGTTGTASLNVYSGAQPATADAATAGTLLVTIPNVCWAESTAGSSALSVVCNGTAATSGTAGWARLETVGIGYNGSAATFRMDGDVGTSATCTFVVNSTEIATTAVVSFLTSPIIFS